MRLSLHGLGSTQFVSPRTGVDPAVAQQACAIAKGIWDPAKVGCNLDMGADWPSYCDWVPFATSLFSDCTLPTTAQELANYSSYSVYQTGQLTSAAGGLDAAKQIEAGAVTDSQALLDSQDCAYKAAAANPALAQVIGPDLTCALTNPFDSYGWAIYAALGLIAFMMLKK